MIPLCDFPVASGKKVRSRERKPKTCISRPLSPRVLLLSRRVLYTAYTYLYIHSSQNLGFVITAIFVDQL